MDTHIRGPVTSGQTDGAIVSQRGFSVLYSNTTTKTLLTIDATATRPVLVEITPVVETVFNAGTTNVVTVGNDSVADAYLGLGDINEASVGVQPSKKFLLRAKTIITAIFTQTGGAATTGQATILISATGVGRGVGITN